MYHYLFSDELWGYAISYVREVGIKVSASRDFRIFWNKNLLDERFLDFINTSGDVAVLFQYNDKICRWIFNKFSM